MKRALFLALLLPSIAFATTFQTKPMLSPWEAKDIASVEIRVKGRLSTDPATTHKIIGRIPLKGFAWVSVATMRFTILVPANQTWEVKSLSANFVPVNTTGLAAFELSLLPLSPTHFAPAGQVLAIDIDPKTGTNVLGPVAAIPTPVATTVPTPEPAPAPVPTPAPAPAPVPAPAPTTVSPDGSRIDFASPAGTRIIALGAEWSAVPQSGGVAGQIGVQRCAGGACATVRSSVDFLLWQGGVIRQFDGKSGDGWRCWNGADFLPCVAP